MPSGPSSPVTPSRKRRTLRLSGLEGSQDSMSPSPYTSGGTNGTAYSRRSSRTSQTSFQPASPLTPRPMSSYSGKFSLHRRRSSHASMSSNVSAGDLGQDGMGNLADELGDAWDEDGAYIQGSSFLEDLREGTAEPGTLSPGLDVSTDKSDMHDFSTGVDCQSPTTSHPQTLQPPPIKSDHSYAGKGSSTSQGHGRADSSYDGSDYGPDEDEDLLDAFPPLLAKRIRDVEKVARMSANTEDTLSEDGGVIHRTAQALKDLGPQSGIENGTTRLITAYNSMATHRTHKTRELFAQAHSLLYGNILSLPEETIDLLLSSITSLAESVPLDIQRSQSPLLFLQILESSTNDLVHSLRSLADVLQESRLAVNAAARRLKAVRELVEEMRIEEELTETSIMLIQAGDWDRRCRERNAARMCREVVTGFSKTCDLVKERFVSTLEMEMEAVA